MRFFIRDRLVSTVTLIGMSGVGKTFLGGSFSKMYGMDFLDTDRLLEAAFPGALDVNIEPSNTDTFLDKEMKVVLSMPAHENCVISTGGSVVYREVAMKYLQTFSVIVYLSDQLEAIVSRIPDLPTRGIVGLGEGGLPALYEKRRFLYERYADVTVDLFGEVYSETLASKIFDALSPLRYVKEEGL